MSEPLTEELLEELCASPSPDAYLREHEADTQKQTLAEYLQELLVEKHLEQSKVVRMADLNNKIGRAHV